MTSGLICPAPRWNWFIPRVREVEIIGNFSFDLIGIGADGEQDTLKKGMYQEEDLSFINAARYPYIKLIFQTEDDINLTAVQLARWLVLFEPVAEGLVFYKGPSSAQVIQEGEKVTRDFGFIN